MPANSLIGGRYQVLDKLGAGGMGVVYRALDKLTGQEVALKQVILSDDQKLADADDIRLALAREFQTLASLRHPHIISVLDYGFDSFQQPFFTMDLLVKSESILLAGRSRSLEGKIDLLVQTLQALVYLHRRNILHRDLKPGNVQTVDGQVKVLDFGLSIRPAMPVPEDGVVGTPAYMSPEVLQGDPATEAADLYAVGVIAYELFAGRHPFDTSRINKLVEDVLSTEPDLSLVATGLKPPVLPEESRLHGAAQSGGEIVDTAGKTTRPNVPGAPDAGQDTADEPTTRVNSQEREESAPDETTRPAKPVALPPTRPSLPIISGALSPAAGSASIDHPVIGVIRKLLEKDPHQRYQDASAVIRDLSAATGSPLPVETTATRESFLQAAQFVGREAELAELTGALNEAMAGRGSGWLIGGESGVGKSRLLNELRTRALVAGALVLRGQAISEAAAPYLVWREPLRRLSLIADLDDADAGILRVVAPDMDELLTRNIPPVPDLDPEQARKLLMGVVASMFHRQTQPVVVILEDLHWAGSESTAILDHLSQSARDLPLLILGSYRNDEVPNLPETVPNMKRLILHRLGEAEIAALSESMLGQAGRETRVLTLLQRETEGNVFFLVEVVRALAEEAGQLDAVGTMTLPAHVFTGGVRRIVERRLGRVPADAYPLLQIAAVLGRQLDLVVLSAADPDQSLAQWLVVCTDAAVLEVQEERWQFAHDKLREGVLAAIPPEARPALHRQSALAIEAVHPDQIEALAYHWGMAGDAAKESHYAILAGDQADRVSAYEEAVTYFKRALELLDSTGAQAQRAVLTGKLGRVYSRLNAHAEATRLLQESFALATETADRPAMAHALACLGNVSQAQGDPASAARYYADSLNLSREIGDKPIMADALRGLARVAEMHGDYTDAARQYEESLNLSREIGDRWRIAMTSGRLAVLATSQGDHAAAIQRLEESLALFREIGDRRGTASALINLGQAAFNQGSSTDAIRHFEDSLVISREIGDRWSVAATLNNLGYIAILSGNQAEARGYLEESLTIFQESGDQAAVGQTLTNLGHVITALGDDQTAAARFREALRIAVAMEAAPLILEIVAGAARLRARAGDPERAVELAGLVLNHPASNSDVKAQADPLVESLRSTLPDATVDAALERGKHLDLDGIVAEILRD